MSLEALGRFLVRRRRRVLGVSMVALLGAIIVVADLNDRLKYEVFADKTSESYRGEQLLEKEFGIGAPNLLLVVSAKSGSVDDPHVAAEAGAMVSRLAGERGVTSVASYWTMGSRPPNLRSAQGDRALVVARILGDDQEVDDRLRGLRPRYHRPGTTIDVRVGGSADFLRDVKDIAQKDQHRSELVTVPVLLLALLVVFGSVVAASLPLAMAVIAVVGTAVVLRAMTEVTNVATFAVFFTTALGLGLGVDYSLFVVNRFREELAAGYGTEMAVIRTVRTAGRTVLFSAAAVLVALTALLLAPLQFLRSMGFAGMATAVMAGIGALVVLPALLAVLGPNVNRWTVWRRSARPADGTGFWHRAAVVVMRRPKVVAGAVLTILLLAGTPVLHLKPGLIDDRDFPKHVESRATGDILRSEFDTRAATPILVVLPGVNPKGEESRLGRFAARLATVPDVARVETASGSYSGSGHTTLPPEVAAGYRSADSTYLKVIADVEPVSAEAERLIDVIRALPSPFGQVLVTGEAASAYDVQKAIVDAIPMALGWIVIGTFVLLFLQFGSVLVPLKAIVLNVLSLSALFGALVWVYQDGHLSGLLDFTATGHTYINVPILIFCVAFGLSMDYHVFLLSRIKEEYDRSGDNESSVALGLERSGRIVSAAAVLIALVFLAAGILSSMAAAKMVGFGLALVVILDAFVIRGTLVPALMKLAGSANWWAPRPLRRLHDRIGISEHLVLAAADWPTTPPSDIGRVGRAQVGTPEPQSGKPWA
jgi:RND superfamily putative drug exporter